jgi:hypothetical protein
MRKQYFIDQIVISVLNRKAFNECSLGRWADREAVSYWFMRDPCHRGLHGLRCGESTTTRAATQRYGARLLRRLREPELRRQLLSEEPSERQLSRLSQARQDMVGRWDRMYVMAGATPDYEPYPGQERGDRRARQLDAGSRL